MKKLIFICIIFNLSIANANINNYCVEPEIEIAITSEAEGLMYNKLIDNYQICMKNFIKQEQAQEQAHSMAVEKAIKKWNKFIKKINKKH